MPRANGHSKPDAVRCRVLASLRAVSELSEMPAPAVLRSGSGWYLADFGIAKNLDRLVTHHTLSMIGTRGYMAPEQRRGTEAAPSADVFSYGKVGTFMLTGQTDPDRIQQEAWWNFVRGCTAHDPSARTESARLVVLLSDLPT